GRRAVRSRRRRHERQAAWEAAPSCPPVERAIDCKFRNAAPNSGDAQLPGSGLRPRRVRAPSPNWERGGGSRHPMPRTRHEDAMTKPLQRVGSPDASDEELARRVAAGDHAAFEAIMRRHNRALFRTARAILRDDAEAEDALQEAYLQAYRTIGGFRGAARLSTWLARVVANEALM